MLCVLKNKFIRLGRDEDGVALVTTLAVFMFMYLVCIGVYAMGTAVKTRIHLQNACDAAAYSAAVVQADTLSRIATLNRAMAWTYIAMSRRQMDYIVDRWLGHTLQHYNDDRTAAVNWYLSGSPCCLWKGNHSWLYGLGPVITLNNHWSTSDIEIESVRAAYQGHLSGQYANGSFYASSDMASQIDQDKRTIADMNWALKYELAQNMPIRIRNAVDEVVNNNLASDIRNRCRPPFVQQCTSPVSSGSGYLRMLRNVDFDEDRFSAFVRQNSMVSTLGPGSRYGQWFVRGNGSVPTEGNNGLQRSYRHWSLGNLQSSWSWQSFRWICTDPEYHTAGYLEGIPRCSHVHDAIRCACTGGAGTFRANVYGDNNAVWNNRYIGEKAEPYILTKAFFDKQGTITVGLACENQNPWAPILGSAIRGIFSAFNYGSELPWTPQYTVCFASAKAGWKEQLNWGNVESVENNRAYRVDWEDGDWNLCQSDWDAVLIPVRRAESLARSKNWEGTVGGFLSTYAENGLGAFRTRMRAGGTELDVDAFYNGRDLGDEYRFGRMTGDRPGFWRGATLPERHKNDGKVNAKWQIGKPNNPISWENLQKVMFH